MAKIAWPINVSAGSPSYDAQAFRQSESVWHTPHSTGTSRPLGAWSGRKPNAWVTTVSGLALTIQPGSGVLDVQTPVATGAYRCSSDAADTSLTANAAHATLERIDGVYVTVDDTDVDASGLRNWVFAYVAGTAATAGTQVPPTTPVRSLRICTVNVPHSGSGSLTITMEPVFTVAAGGILPTLSTNRPAVPYSGQVIFETDTGITWTYNGVTAAWEGGFTSYTPTLTQPGAITKTVSYAKYVKEGKQVSGNVLLTVTSAGTTANSVIVGLPTTAAYSGLIAVGSFYVIRASIRYAGTLINAGSGTCYLQAHGTVNTVGIDAAFALANGDLIGYQFAYETA